MNPQTIPTITTHLGFGDRLGRWGARWTLGRGRYRAAPGLYRIGNPEPASPVLVTANYKLTLDALRSELDGVDAWVLVLDTNGVNVWCAAGKGTFGTDELVRRVKSTGLEDLVSHRKLLVPQLGATGVAAHEVKRLCGFRVIFGPVRARDIKAFLDARMRATDEMRRVSFTLAERLELIGAEVVPALKWALIVILFLMLFSGADSLVERFGKAILRGAPLLGGFLAGTVLVPVLLPWIPGRAFSLKGAILGVIVVGGAVLLLPGAHSAIGKVQVLLLGTAIASFFAMQFTGATTFTSPSGVEWEMKRALPFHVGAIVLVLGIGIVRAIVGPGVWS